MRTQRRSFTATRALCPDDEDSPTSNSPSNRELNRHSRNSLYNELARWDANGILSIAQAHQERNDKTFGSKSKVNNEDKMELG